MKTYNILTLFLIFALKLNAQTYNNACVIVVNTGVFGTTIYTNPLVLLFRVHQAVHVILVI
ncbi:hypothetical protein [Pedobacter sp. Leaf132]|uniref:hypothetical protein n=1 Tax=Pedobacter sp. Leaf132 TaxID=2876557 RepID=UPI001E38A261|nr:hypothetical protein [Pedobacter sp. Leaf132]